MGGEGQTLVLYGILFLNIKELEKVFVNSGNGYEIRVRSMVDSILYILEMVISLPCSCPVAKKDIKEKIGVLKKRIEFLADDERTEEFVMYLTDEEYSPFFVEEMLRKSVLLFHKVEREKSKLNGKLLTPPGVCVLACYNCLMYLMNGLLVSMIDYPEKIGNVFKNSLFLDSVDELDKKITSVY